MFIQESLQACYWPTRKMKKKVLKVVNSNLTSFSKLSSLKPCLQIVVLMLNIQFFRRMPYSKTRALYIIWNGPDSIAVTAKSGDYHCQLNIIIPMIINTPHNWIQLFLKLPIITLRSPPIASERHKIRQQYPHLHLHFHHHHHCDEQGPPL